MSAFRPREVTGVTIASPPLKRWGALLAMSCALMILPACTDRAPTTTQPATEPVAAKGRAQLWAENCIRCHNARSPAYYSGREWDVAMHHMRVRCYLTAKEARAITQFIQSAND